MEMKKYFVIDGFGSIQSMHDTKEDAEEQKNFYQNVWEWYGMTVTNDFNELVRALQEEINDKEQVMEIMEMIGNNEIF